MAKQAGAPHRGRDLKGVLNWPRDISRSKRVAQSTGYRAFGTVHQGTSVNLFQHQPINVKGHVLATVSRGRLLVQHEDNQELIHPGQCVVMTDGKFVISEIAESADPGGMFTYFSFSTKVLAQQVSHCENVTLLAMSSRSYPGNIAMASFAHSKLPIVAATYAAHDLLGPLIRTAFTELRLAFLKLCLEKIVVPRMRIVIFLDNLVLRPTCEHAAILARYPGGKNALRREMTALQMPSIPSIVKTRRRELFQLWRSHGANEKDILRAFHLKSLELHARRDVSMTGTTASRPAKRKRGRPPKARSPQSSEPVSTTEAKLPLRTDDKQSVHAGHTMPISELPSSQLTHPTVTAFGYSIVSSEYDEDFWAMKHTGIRQFIKSANLTEVSGLEDCEQLLLAA